MSEVDDLNEQIVADENEIEKLQEETREYRNEIMELKNKMVRMRGLTYDLYREWNNVNN